MASLDESIIEGQLTEVGDLDRAALDRLGVRYTVHENFPLADIDDGASRAAWNQARLGEPVDNEHVEQLLSDLERGAEFPPIIVYRDESDRYVTLSGNHRRRTHELGGRETIRAYEAVGLKGLRKEDERVLRLIYEANHGHGKPVALDDRVRQAISLIENGYTVRAAATAVGVPESRVRDQHELARATHRLEELGVDTSPIRISNQRRLMNIKNDKVLQAAARAVPLMEKQTEEVNDLVKRINTERTESAQLALVQDYTEALQAHEKDETETPRRRGRSDGLTPDVRRFHTALGQIARFDTEALRSGIPADFRDKLIEKVREAAATLSAAEQLL